MPAMFSSLAVEASHWFKSLQKQFGATREEINKMVSEGKIGFPQVKEAIVSMTSSGGQFYNLMEEQSKTITGQISNLQDLFDMMFNDLGKQNEGLINDALSGIGYLIDHYKEIGAVLKPLIISYGTYKAALIATAAVEKVIAAGRSVQYFTLLTTRIGAATAAQRAFQSCGLEESIRHHGSRSRQPSCHPLCTLQAHQ